MDYLLLINFMVFCGFFVLLSFVSCPEEVCGGAAPQFFKNK